MLSSLFFSRTVSSLAPQPTGVHLGLGEKDSESSENNSSCGADSNDYSANPDVENLALAKLGSQPELIIDFDFLVSNPLLVTKDFREPLSSLSGTQSLNILIKNNQIESEDAKKINEILSQSGIQPVFWGYDEYDLENIFLGYKVIDENWFVLSFSETVTRWAKKNRVMCANLNDRGTPDENDIWCIEEALSSMQVLPRKIIISLDLDDTTIFKNKENFMLNHTLLQRLLKKISYAKERYLGCDLEFVVTTARKPPRSLGKEYVHELEESGDNDTTKEHVNFLLAELNRLNICNQKQMRVFHTNPGIGFNKSKSDFLLERFLQSGNHSENNFVIHIDDNPDVLKEFSYNLPGGIFSVAVSSYMNCLDALTYWWEENFCHCDDEHSGSDSFVEMAPPSF